jgi:hypothetical protein
MSPGVDSKEWIPPAYVAWRTGLSNRVVVPARQAGNRFLGFLKGLKIRALASVLLGGQGWTKVWNGNFSLRIFAKMALKMQKFSRKHYRKNREGALFCQQRVKQRHHVKKIFLIFLQKYFFLSKKFANFRRNEFLWNIENDILVSTRLNPYKYCMLTRPRMHLCYFVLRLQLLYICVYWIRRMYQMMLRSSVLTCI